jgi:hypothetical protein
VAHVRLLHARHRRLAALFEELHDVEAVGAAQDVAHLARLQRVEHLGEERRQARRGAPAQASALQRVRRIREARRHLREIRAFPQLRERLQRAPAPLLDHLAARLRGHQHEDVREAELRIVRLLLRLAGDFRLDLGIGHDELVVHLALA